MSQAKIKVTIKNSQTTKIKDYQAMITEEKINYKEEDNTIVIFNKKTNELTRKNEKLQMKYSFNQIKTTTATIKIKELNKEIQFEMITKKLIQEPNKIEITYKINSDEFYYKIEVIE